MRRMLHSGSRRGWRWISIIAVFALVVAACGDAATNDVGTDETIGDEQISGELKVWTWLDPGAESSREVAFGQLIDSFAAAHPDVDLVVESQPWQELRSLYLAAVQTGNAPDVIWLVHQDLAGVDEGGGLADLNEVLSADFADNVMPDLTEGAKAAGNVAGEQLGLGLWPNPGNVMAYREDLLDAAGLDAFPTTWDEVIALADVEGDWEYPLAIPLSTPTKSVFFPMMLSFPSQPLDPDTWEFDLTGAEAIEVAETIRTAFQNGVSPKDMVIADDDDVQDQFATGRFGAAHMFAPRFPVYRDQAAGYEPGSLRMAMNPAMGGGEPRSVAQFWSIAMAEDSENKPAAAAFIEHMYTTEASIVWAQVGGQVPDRISALDDPWFDTEEAAAIKLMAELTADPGVTPVPANVRDGEILFDIMNDALQEVATTDRPIEEILTEARDQLGW